MSLTHGARACRQETQIKRHHRRQAVRQRFRFGPLLAGICVVVQILVIVQLGIVVVSLLIGLLRLCRLFGLWLRIIHELGIFFWRRRILCLLRLRLHRRINSDAVFAGTAGDLSG